MARFAKYAWGVLAANLAVVLWGAYVRASGSGAGCGSDWPLCRRGDPSEPRAGHPDRAHPSGHQRRGPAARGWVVRLVRRAAPGRSPVRLGAGLALGFMLGEALLGAGLVLFELVAHNDSLTRAFSLAAHLLNTFLLLGSLALTAWWASRGDRVRLQARSATPWLVGIALLGTLLVGMTGAITALGDTLFPPASVLEGIRQDASPTAHLLVRLRVLHPALAVAVGLYLVGFAASVGARPANPATGRLAWGVGALVLMQWGAGLINIALLAPVWLQLLHLLVADLVWIALVLLGAAALSTPATAHRRVPAARMPQDAAADSVSP